MTWVGAGERHRGDTEYAAGHTTHHTVCTYSFGGRRFLASSRYGHDSTSLDIYILLRKESLLEPYSKDVFNNSIRIKVEAMGPARRFVVDGVKGEDNAEAAAQILKDLGVTEDNIVFDRGRFMPRERM